MGKLAASTAASPGELEIILPSQISQNKKRKETNPFLLPSLINETFYPKSSNMNYAGFWEHN